MFGFKKRKKFKKELRIIATQESDTHVNISVHGYANSLIMYQTISFLIKEFAEKIEVDPLLIISELTRDAIYDEL